MKYVWPVLALAWCLFVALGVGSVPPLGRLLDLHAEFWAHRPHTLGDSVLPGLVKPVQVAWDKNGVPHFFAESEDDLYRAQGFVMASQRLFQMDLSTRQSLGRLSEWVGEKTVEMDRFQILFGMRQSIAQTAEKFLKNPVNAAMLNSFTAGVNAYIDSHPHDLPPEYTLLGVRPEAFTPLRVIAMDKLLTFSLAGRSFAPYLTGLQQKLGTEKVLDLYPEFFPSQYEDYVVPDKGGKPRRAEAASDFPFVSHLKNIPSFPLPNPGKGSNNWAVAPSRSATGHSLFANDTHLGYSLPNVWYESQLSCPGFNVYGVSLVGIPGVVNGFNGRVAWGPTNGTTPVLDWFEVEFENETSTNYRVGEEWRHADVTHESLGLKGSAPQTLDVVWTIHGPVLYREGRYGLAANWMGHRPGDELMALHGLYTTKSADECLKSFHDHWSVPIQNFICADADHIELLHAGRVPERRIGEGRFVMDGRDAHDSLGAEIPEADHPRLINPAEGLILSANQKIEGPSYPHYLGWDYEEPFRGMMIRRRLHEKDKLSAEDMIRIQNDSYDLQAEYALPWLLKALKSDGLTAEQKSFVERLERWKYEAKASDAEPALYKAWFLAFKASLADGVFLKDMRVIWLLKRLSENAQDSDKQWVKGSLSESVTAAFLDAWRTLSARLGGQPEKWTWAAYNAAQLPHIARLPGWGSGILQMDGSGESVRGNHGRHGPVYKAVFEFGEPTRVWMQVPGGNEGDPFNPAFGRFAKDWAAGEMRPVEYYKDAAEAKSKAERMITLRPESH